MKNVKSEHTKFFQSEFMYVVLCINRAVDNNWDGHHFAKEFFCTELQLGLGTVQKLRLPSPNISI